MDSRHGRVKRDQSVARTLQPIQSIRRLNSSSGAMTKARYRVAWQARADASEANGSRNLKCRDPLKWISLAALMNFEGKRESLTAEIRNSIIGQNGNCKTQTNKPSENSRVNAPSQLPCGSGIWALSDF
jgi:hypothetical protein